MAYIAKLSNSGGVKSLNRYVSALAGNAAYEPGSYDSIATLNGTGSATIATFTNIPQTYTHLQVRAIVRTTLGATSDTIYAYNYNNNTNSTGSAYHFLVGNGSNSVANSGFGSYSTPLGYTAASSANANVYGAFIFDILDYTNTNKYKTTRTLFGWENNTNGEVGLTSGLPVTLPGTNAVTSLAFAFNGNITTASQFALYGIKG